MTVLAEVTRFTTLAGVTARTTLSSKKGAVTWIVALLPLYVVGALAALGREVDLLLYQNLVVPLFLNVVLIVIALVHGSRLFKEEVDDNTLVYLTTRRISKASLVAYKFLGYYASALLVLLLPLVASFAIAQGTVGSSSGEDWATLWALMGMGAVGAAAFGGLFLLMGLVLKRPLVIGLLYGFFWESIAQNFPGDVPLLSISHYLRSMGRHLVSVGPLGDYVTSLDFLWATAIPLLVALGALVLAWVTFLTREIASRE